MKKLIFDFGNVIAIFNPKEVYQDYTETDEDAIYISDHFDKKGIWKQMVKGKKIEKVYEKAIKKVDKKYHESIDLILNDWYKYFVFDQDMVAYIKELKDQDYKLYLLSNFSSQFENILSKHKDFFELFEGLYISYQRGFVKPTYIVFLDFLKQYNLEAKDCLLIDDKKKNIEIAEELEFETYLYDGNLEKLKNHIKKLN